MHIGPSRHPPKPWSGALPRTTTMRLRKDTMTFLPSQGHALGQPAAFTVSLCLSLPCPLGPSLPLSPTAHSSPPTPFQDPALDVCAFACACLSCALLDLPTPSPTARPSPPFPWASFLQWPACLLVGCCFQTAWARTRSTQPAASSSALLEWHGHRVQTQTARLCNERTHTEPVLSSPEAHRFEAPHAVSE